VWDEYGQIRAALDCQLQRGLTKFRPMPVFETSVAKGRHRWFSLLLPGLLIVSGSVLADSAETNQRRITKLADGVYSIEHKY
jgi:hypothetical protein